MEKELQDRIQSNTVYSHLWVKVTEVLYLGNVMTIAEEGHDIQSKALKTDSIGP